MGQARLQHVGFVYFVRSALCRYPGPSVGHLIPSFHPQVRRDWMVNVLPGAYIRTQASEAAIARRLLGPGLSEATRSIAAAETEKMV